MITNVEISEINLTPQTQYKPILNKIIDENEKPQGKYLSSRAYKAKLEKRWEIKNELVLYKRW